MSGLVIARRSALAWLGGALLASLACAAQGHDETVKDDRGVTVTLPQAPRRIVSLMPSLTESVCALGGCARLVGTDRYSNWPASVVALPKLGGLYDVQVESIVALKPDVVLASTSARVTDRLEALGLKVVVLETRNREDVKRTLALLGHMLDAGDAADQAWNGIEQATREAARRVPAALRGKRVYFEIDATPYAAGPTSFVGETLERLGMSNAIPASLGPFPKLNPEYVVSLQPDVVMASGRDLQDMAGRPGWSSLKALRLSWTCGFDGPARELLVRPGPRMGEAAGILADCLAAIGKNH